MLNDTGLFETRVQHGQVQGSGDDSFIDMPGVVACLQRAAQQIEEPDMFGPVCHARQLAVVAQVCDNCAGAELFLVG